MKRSSPAASSVGGDSDTPLQNKSPKDKLHHTVKSSHAEPNITSPHSHNTTAAAAEDSNFPATSEIVTQNSANSSFGPENALPAIPFSKLSPNHIILDQNRIYDITEFLHKHPGGPVMLQQATRRRAAWELFVSHHPSYVVEKFEEYLPEDALIGVLQEESHKHLTKKDYTLQMEAKYHSVYSEFYATLKKRVEGYLKEKNLKPRDQFSMYLKAAGSIALYVMLYVALYFVASVKQSWLATILLSVVWGWATANIGMGIMHDGNHGAFSNWWQLNSAAGYSFDMMGGSSFVWRMIHTNGHHVNTNVEEKDPDIHTNEPHFRRIRESQSYHFWYWFQPFYLPLMYSSLIFEFAFRDFAAMVLGAWGGTVFQEVSLREWTVFLLVKLWYICYQFIIPHYWAGVSWTHIALVYCLCSMVGSEILVCMFQVNHVTDKTEMVHCEEDSREVHQDWASMQIRGSSNFAPGSWFWNHFSGGLNHQIEHHLFPTVSHVHYPSIQPIVEKTCHEFGVPYSYYKTFWQAICGHFRVLWKLSYRPEQDKVKHD